MNSTITEKQHNNKYINSILTNILRYKYLILISITIITYISGINGKFVIDDIELIQNDSFYQTEKNPLKCFTRSFWKKSRQQNLYRPIPALSYWIQTKIFPKNSAYFQVTFRIINLILHICAVILLFKLLELLTFSKLTSFFASILFAIHPIHVEAVTPAFGRAELLCAIFLLLTFIFHIKSKKYFPYTFYAAIFAFSAFLSKENGIVFLPIIFLIDVFFDNKSYIQKDIKTNILKYTAYITSVAGVFIMHKIFLHCWIPDKQHFCAQIDNPLATISPSLRFISAIRIQGIALYKFFFPAVLSHDYSYAQILPSTSIFDIYAILTAILIFLIPIISIYFFPKFKKYISFLTTAYIISIIPAGNFLIPAGTIFAERLQYFPSIFLCSFFALIIIQTSKKLKTNILFIIFTLIIFIFSLRTIFRTFDWYDNETLNYNALITSPNSVKTWNNIAVVFINKKQYPEALAACTQSLKIYNKNTTAYANRALTFIKLRDFKAAENDISKAISIEPNNYYANFLMGFIYLHKNQKQKALIHWLNLQKRFPQQPDLKKAIQSISD